MSRARKLSAVMNPNRKEKKKKNKTKWGKYLKKTGTQDGTGINRLLYPLFHISLFTS